MSLEPLVYLNAIAPLSDGLKAKLGSLLKQRSYRRKEYLLREGQINNCIYFITKGLIRIYYMHDGLEICSGLLCERALVISVRSFFKQEASTEYMQAIEDTDVSYITY